MNYLLHVFWMECRDPVYICSNWVILRVNIKSTKINEVFIITFYSPSCPLNYSNKLKENWSQAKSTAGCRFLLSSLYSYHMCKTNCIHQNLNKLLRRKSYNLLSYFILIHMIIQKFQQIFFHTVASYKLC